MWLCFPQGLRVLLTITIAIVQTLAEACQKNSKQPSLISDFNYYEVLLQLRTMAPYLDRGMRPKLLWPYSGGCAVSQSSANAQRSRPYKKFVTDSPPEVSTSIH